MSTTTGLFIIVAITFMQAAWFTWRDNDLKACVSIGWACAILLSMIATGLVPVKP
jgi:hypothetical protein